MQKFKAVWKENQNEQVICIGNMNRSVDVYGVNGMPLAILSEPLLTAIPAVNAFHPSHAIIVSGNASGRMTVWK